MNNSTNNENNSEHMDLLLNKAKDKILDAEDVTIFTHTDCDGITAGSILSSLLDKLEIDHSVNFVEINEVESMEFQMSMFNDFSDELVELMLAQYAETNAIEEQTKEIKNLYEKWKTGTMSSEDVSDEADIDMDSLTEEQKALLDEYNKSMLTDRNAGMTEKLIEYMKGDKTAMLVVGSAHFLGDDGIISLLQKQGITVTKITSPDQITVTEKLPEAA